MGVWSPFSQPTSGADAMRQNGKPARCRPRCSPPRTPSSACSSALFKPNLLLKGGPVPAQEAASPASLHPGFKVIKPNSRLFLH
jgi:hypothetical protein